jgi:hypothetical protein
MVQQCLFNIRRMKTFDVAPKNPQTFTDAQLRAFLSGCITTWNGNCTDSNRRALQRVVGLPNASSGANYLPSRTPTAPYVTGRPKRSRITNHPSHCLFTPLSSRRRGQYRCIKAGTERLKNSVYLRLFNWHH